jgi:hypothetical protein
MEGEKCDFCSSPDVRWAFPANNTTTPVPLPKPNTATFNSLGSWAACQLCHDLIVAGKRDELAERSARTMKQIYRTPGSISSLVAMIRPLHDDFWANRHGDPVPTKPGDPDPFPVT